MSIFKLHTAYKTQDEKRGTVIVSREALGYTIQRYYEIEGVKDHLIDQLKYANRRTAFAWGAFTVACIVAIMT